MDDRTQAFVNGLLQAQERLRLKVARPKTKDPEHGRDVRDAIFDVLRVRAVMLELVATVSRSEYLDFPAMTLDELMRSLSTCAAGNPSHFRVDVAGIPLMGIMSSQGLASLYRLLPGRMLN